MALDDRTAEQVAKINEEIAERENARAAILEEAATRKVQSLETFNALSSQEKRELFHQAPDQYRKMMDAKREHAERKLRGRA